MAKPKRGDQGVQGVAQFTGAGETTLTNPVSARSAWQAQFRGRLAPDPAAI